MDASLNLLQMSALNANKNPKKNPNLPELRINTIKNE